MICRHRAAILGALNAALILSVLSFTQAGATPIAYNISQGSSGGFQFSFLHNASNAAGFAPFYPGGTLLGRISGMLLGDIDATDLTLSPSVLSVQGLGPAPILNDLWTMEVGGGTITLPDGSFTGNLLGTIDYTIRRNDSTVFDTGSFYFFDVDFPGPPTQLSATGLHLWANNWNHLLTDRTTFVNQGGTPLGIDLGSGPGTGPIVPEPASAWLAAMAALSSIMMLRKRRLGAKR